MREGFREEKRIADRASVEASLSRLADELIASTDTLDRLALVGIYTRGVPMSQRLQALIEERSGIRVPLGMIDISLYRDDALEGLPSPVVGETKLDFPSEGFRIVLVDDVLYTGRTVRAALDAIVDFGRPQAIQLLVLADRGHRELPIEPQYVGHQVQTRRQDSVKVTLEEVSGGSTEIIHYIA